MALSNIADVTRSMITLVEWALRVSGDWPVGGTPKVHPLPPDKMAEDGISIFLYHVQENVHNRNMHLMPTGPNQPPVQSAPMGLNLFYQMSAKFTDTNPDTVDAYEEQLMMSIALKAMHDYPEINDATELREVDDSLTNIFGEVGLQGRNNRFKISLQPIPHNDAVHFWTAGQSPLRLAAYYEVSVIFLEPKLRPTLTGRVLAYGTYIFTEGAPRITATRNTLSFTIPGEAEIRQIDLQPAQVPPGNLLDFTGVNFGGDRIELQLFKAGWAADAVVVDAAWNLTLSGDNKLSVTVQETVTLPDATTVAVLPGVYKGQVNVFRRRTLPNGQTREFKQASNQFPFTISPRIDLISPPVANVITVTGYRFQHPDLPVEAVDVYVGDNRLTQTSAPPGPGEFSVTGPATLAVSLPAGLVAGQILPLRIVVAGAESPPNWITTP